MKDSYVSRSGSKTLAERLNGLRWRLRATRRLWRKAARPEMPMLEPKLTPTPPPPPPPPEPIDRGRLDGPVQEGAVARGPITFFGWVLFHSGPTLRVDVELGGRRLGPARLGMPRPDVAAALGLDQGAPVGFELTVNLRHWPELEDGVRLEAMATGPGGERLELGPVELELELAEPEPERAPWAGLVIPAKTPELPGLRTLVVTHQLDLGGAQLYLMDLLRELLRTEANAPTVVSAKDGRLRADLEELGIPVHLSGLPPIDSLTSYRGRAAELAGWAAEREFEAAFVNTATSYVLTGVEAARLLGIPGVWAIHESYEPELLWNHADPAVRREAEAALAEVAQPLFVAAATQRLFEPAIGAGRGLAMPYGLDLEPIDEFRRGFDRAAARRRAGIPADAEVILCVGSVEPRKAQVPLAQAFDRVAATHPRARLALVGAGKDAYNELLADYASGCAAADRIEVVKMTGDVHSWFGVADLVVCASDIESLPRTLLEAMAWELPVLSTEIFGIPELIEDGVSGWLCEPRDLAALAAGLERALAASPEQRRRIGRTGRALVEQRHSLEGYGRTVAGLLEGLAQRSALDHTVDAAAG